MQSTCVSDMKASSIMDDAKSLNKCTWTKFQCGAKTVTKVVATPCGSNIAELTCNKVARCIWQKAIVEAAGIEASGAQCTDINCAGFTKDTDCTQKTAGVNNLCAWDATAKTCSKKVVVQKKCNE